MTIQIGMWTGPRNISTTMMRSFENRPDCGVIDEPFYAYYLKKSGADHPMRAEILGALPQDWRDVADLLNGPAPGGENLFFHKHISYHFSVEGELPLDWIDSQRTFLLIRDPRAMVASYAKKFPDVAPIAQSLAVQARIHDYLSKTGKPCPIVDATDILKNPEGMMRALCDALDIPFTENMLLWPEGARATDGVWGPHWYDAVTKSTGFKPYQEREIDLSPELEKIADDCAAPYQDLYKQRIHVS